MAGIGFVLRKLARQNNLIGLIQAYTHSALASTGPWILTVIAIGSIMAFGGRFASRVDLYDFRIIIIYNFGFSLVMSGPIFMTVTRYLADRIHFKDVSSAPGMLIGALLLIFVTQFPVVFLFYIYYSDFILEVKLLAIANFMLISIIWLISVFITALKDYKTVTQAFVIGMTITVLAAVFFARFWGANGMLAGFNIGLTYIIGVLIARIFAEYPYRLKEPFGFLGYFKKYWELALGGFVYNAGVWADKWVMWFAPEAEKMSNGLVLYPNYDSAMFLAYLTIVPSMAIFVFSIETNFFEHYLRFYRDIQSKANFRKIQQNHHSIIRSIFSSSRNFLILQGSICGMSIILAPKIFDALGVNYLQIGIFRYGVLGAFFQVLTLFLTILLSYFDNRRYTLLIQIFFLITNAGFTFFFMSMDFKYYGYGYFLSTVSTFVLASLITIGYVIKLPYHTFITTNTSVS